MKSGYEKFFSEAQKATGLKKKDGTKFKISRSVRGETPEDRVRQELASRLHKKQQQMISRRSKPAPIGSIAGIAVTFGLCIFGYYNSDLLDEWMGKIEISAFGRAGASETPDPAQAKKAPPKEEKTAAKADGKKEKSAEANVASSPVEVPNTKNWTAEELSFFAKLNDRKKELDLRESELNKLEEELHKRKSELDAKLLQLESMRGEISKTLKARVANDAERVDKLVQVYSSMKAPQAAKVIESLNEDLAVEILDKMKKKSAAEILDTMSAKKARRLSELLTGYQRTTASAGPGEAGGETDGDDQGGSDSTKTIKK